MSSDDVPSPLHGACQDGFCDNPGPARVTLRAKGIIGPDGACKIETTKGGAEAGLHPILGADGKNVCANDVLLEALVGCAGVTLGQMATAMDIDLRKAAIRAEGDLDLRGLPGLSKQAGLQNIRLHFEVDSDATAEQLPVLVRLTERYCVVSRTLNPPAAISFCSSASSDSAGESA